MAIPNLGEAALRRWQNDPFYTKALVLGIDVGLSYIGLHLRLGPEVLVGETVVHTARASLEARRLKRHWRRNRRAAKHRVFLLRRWCRRFGLPWLNVAEWQPAMEPAFRLRLQGEVQPGSLTPLQLVICLRHTLVHRGYDWHRLGGSDGLYPWGNKEPLSVECRQWLESQFITPEVAAATRQLVAADLSPEDFAVFGQMLDAAIKRSEQDGIVPHLRTHAAAPLVHRARGRNFPREVLEAHTANLIRPHAHHFPTNRMDEALSSFIAILNHHRKDEAAQKAHWESKAGLCPFTGEPRAPAGDPDVLRFRLLEFLSTRRFAMIPIKKSPLPPVLAHVKPEIVAWLLQHPEGQSEPLPVKGDLRREFEHRACPAGMKLASDTKTLNKDFFSQLRDLLYPRPASAARRAALSARASREWFAHATAGGTCFFPDEVRLALNRPRTPGESSFYERRREAALAEWFHPHVEFLLGPRAYLLKGQPPPAGQIHGWLNRLLARPKVRARLTAAGHTGKPDYVVIEVAGDIPRTAAGRKKIEDENKERRAARDGMMARYNLPKGDENSLLRAALWEQQGGTDRLPAHCPLTGTELTGGPLNHDFEVAHIYPRTWGGPYQRDNLFLTTKAINASMNDTPPALCAGFDPTQMALMRWPQRKRDLFVTPWQRNGALPDWGFSTRVAQLARQLRDAMKTWLGITDENEFVRRVGTVTGFFTAQCRKTWLVGYRKDRADLRNHLYDAMVLASIPPGVGLNSAAHGGIFVTEDRRLPGGGMVTTYRPPAALGPDWQAFDRTHVHDCLVARPIPSASKTSRFDASIYGIEKVVHTGKDGRPEKALRLRIREAITQGGWPVNDAEKWLAAATRKSPAFARSFPEKHWRAWLAENSRLKEENGRRKKAGEPPLLPAPLRATSSNAPMRALTVAASKPDFFDPSTLAPHDRRGAKNPVERNVALELFEATDVKGRNKVCSRTVLHPRLAALHAQWRQRGVEVPGTEPLPDCARRVARVTKGDVLCLPLRKDGELATNLEEAYCRVWYLVTALKTAGQIEMKPAEFNPAELSGDEDGTVSREGSRLFGLRLKPVFKAQNESLLKILRMQPHCLPA